MNRLKFLKTSLLAMISIPLVAKAGDKKPVEKTPEKVYFTACDQQNNYICEIACEYSAFKNGRTDIVAKLMQKMIQTASDRGMAIRYINSSFDADKMINL